MLFLFLDFPKLNKISSEYIIKYKGKELMQKQIANMGLNIIFVVKDRFLNNII